MCGGGITAEFAQTWTLPQQRLNNYKFILVRSVDQLKVEQEHAKKAFQMLHFTKKLQQEV